MKDIKMKVVHQNEEKKTETSREEEAASLYGILKELPKPDVKFRLNSSQKYWYKYFGEELISTGKLAKVDLIHLVTLSIAVSTFSEAVKMMNEKGYNGGVVQTFGSGAQQISPHIVVQNKQIPVIKEISAHFGFGFKDRTKIKTVEDGGLSNQLSLLDQIDEMLKGQAI
jgi:hypothetical protein